MSPLRVERRKNVYSWRATAREAAAFLRAIQPYLITERRRDGAALAIAFQDQKRNHGRFYPSDYLELQEQFYVAMRMLNRGAA